MYLFYFSKYELMSENSNLRLVEIMFSNMSILVHKIAERS